MLGMCRQCGTVGSGRNYTFYHGKVQASSFGGDPRLGQKVVFTTYGNIQEATCFLCSRCVRRSRWAPFFLVLGGGAALVGLGVLFIWIEHWLWLPCLLGALCVFLFLPGFLSTKIAGNIMAVSIGRKDFPASDSFWDPNEYQQLLRGNGK